MEFGAAAGETVIVRNPSLPYAFRVSKEILEKFPGKLEDILGRSRRSGPREVKPCGKFKKLNFNKLVL